MNNNRLNNEDISRKDNFLWRPNDYSSETLNRYDQEAEHWTRAFKGAMSNKSSGNSTGEFFSVINLIINVLFLILINIISLIKKIITLIFNSNKSNSNKSRYDEVKKTKIGDNFTNDELNKMFGPDSEYEKNFIDINNYD